MGKDRESGDLLADILRDEEYGAILIRKGIPERLDGTVQFCIGGVRELLAENCFYLPDCANISSEQRVVDTADSEHIPIV